MVAHTPVLLDEVLAGLSVKADGRYCDATFGRGYVRALRFLSMPRQGPFAGGILPVSYTHLRAHETVLDLVCRLLLEKKKTKS